MGKRKYLNPLVEVVSLTQIDVLGLSQNDNNVEDAIWNFDGLGGFSS